MPKPQWMTLRLAVLCCLFLVYAMASEGKLPPVHSSDSMPEISPGTPDGDPNYTAPYFPLLGFKQYENNPIMAPNPANKWESAYLYNPSAIVLDDKVFLIYRAQNESKTSTVGLAWSSDGYNFTRYNKPILEPTEPYEHIGGCEDPRVVRVNGTFYLTYTAYDNTTARLCLATSTNLEDWEKHGPLFPDFSDILYNWKQPGAPLTIRHGWTKSGAIFPERQSNGYYYMIFGESWFQSANSTDLVHWKTTAGDVPVAEKLTIWEQGLMEPGPPGIKTRDGKWIQIYNGVATGMEGYKPQAYSTGQMLLDMENAPAGPPLARLERPILTPTTEDEVEGQVDNVVFSEGLVQFKQQWFLYYGAGDQYLSVASAPVQP